MERVLRRLLEQRDITFTAALTVSPSPGGPVTYHWVRDGMTLMPQTVTIAPGATTATVTDVWNWTYFGSPGDHYEQMVVTAPNSRASNQAHSTGGGCN